MTRTQRLQLCGGLLGLAAVSSAFPTDQAWQTLLRLILAGLLLLWLPGWAILDGCGLFPELESRAERTLLAVGLSYALVTLACIGATLCQLNIRTAVALLVLFNLGLAAALPLPEKSKKRRQAPAPDVLHSVAFASAALIVWFAWRVEAQVGGEGVVELISVRKVLENPHITLTGLISHPDYVPTYIFVPYYFLTAALTKLAGLSFFVVYIKMRALYVGLALLAFWALVRRLSGSLTFGLAAFLGLSALILIDPGPTSWPSSLVPTLHRGGFSAGVMIPLLMLSTLLAGSLKPGKGRFGLRWEYALPGIFATAALMTHALEMLTFYFFLVAVAVTPFLSRQKRLNRRSVLWVVAFIFLSAALFRIAHGHLVGHIADFEHDRKEFFRGKAHELLTNLNFALTGPVPFESNYLISVLGPVTIYPYLALAGLPLLLWLLPVPGLIVGAAMLAPLAIYVIPGVFALVVLITTVELAAMSGYFALLGNLAFLLLVFLGVRPADRWLSKQAKDRSRLLFATAGLGLVGGLLSQVILLKGLWALGDFVFANARLVILLAVAAGVAVLVYRGFFRKGKLPPDDLPELKQPAAVIFVYLCVLAPLFSELKAYPVPTGYQHPAGILQQLTGKGLLPQVTDWDAFYPAFTTQTNPPLDIPWNIVEDLRRALQPGEIVTYDPAKSYAIPMLLNVYIVNPGQLFSSDMEYHERFVGKDAGGGKVHPVYNSSAGLSPLENEFLARYKVRYILTNPAYHDTVDAKLRLYPQRFRRIYDKIGYAAYEIAG